MKIARWGNSLAVRLPGKLVKELGLEEGDEIEIAAARKDRLDVVHNPRKANLVARMKALSAPLPPGFKFNRNELYDTARNGFRVDDDVA